jgi:hypothetical protein
MAATHIFPAFVLATGEVHPSHTIASGRSAALFATLAGVGLALANGGGTPLRGRALWGARAGVSARAGLLLVLGLLLARVDSPPLVILHYYGLLFLVALPVLGLSARALAVLAVLAGLVTPLVSHWLRSGMDPAPIAEASGGSNLPVELLLTGTYPVLTWSTYLLAGMAIGRAGLRGWRAALRLVGLGLAVAVGAKVVSAWLLEAVGGVRALERAGHSLPWPVQQSLDAGMFGTAPATDWRWLTVSAPHAGTTLDLAHTIGTSMLVLGACLVLGRLLPSLGLLPFAAAGSMTLSLYCVHVLALSTDSPFLHDVPLELWLAHVVVALVVATIWRTAIGRGPLEALAAAVDRSARRVVGGRSGEDRPLASASWSRSG